MAGGAQENLDADDWSRFLTERLGTPVRASFGRSRTAPVQARVGRTDSGDPVWEIRLHSMFRGAPHEVREALVKWLRVGRRATRAGPVLDEWIHAELARLPRPKRKLTLDTAGEVHDLGAMAEVLLRTEFADDFEPEGSVEAPLVSWGRRVLSRSRRSLRLGSFEPENRIVRVHPVLDQLGVPAWFVTFVLKHELLHAVIDAYRDPSGRWVHHGPEFRAREASWPEYEPAVAWERRNLARLIRAAREGTKLRVRDEDLVLPPGVVDIRTLVRTVPGDAPPIAAHEPRLDEDDAGPISGTQALLFDEPPGGDDA